MRTIERSSTFKRDFKREIKDGEASSPGSSQDGQGFKVRSLIVGETEERPLMVVVAGANGSGKTSF